MSAPAAANRAALGCGTLDAGAMIDEMGADRLTRQAIRKAERLSATGGAGDGPSMVVVGRDGCQGAGHGSHRLSGEVERPES